MAKDYSSKVQFFSKKGVSLDLINFVVSLDPGKHFSWFIETLNKFTIFDKALSEQCLMILNMFQKAKPNGYPSSLENAIVAAKRFKEFEDSYDSRVLMTFDNGYHIYLLTHEELNTEGSIMSNCLGQYTTDVREKQCAIISLRDKSRKSIANVQVLPNGSVAQNFEKGNRQVKFSNWKYISEFFSKNSKDFSKLVGIDGKPNITVLTVQGGEFCLPMLAQGIPTSIKTFITDNGEIKTVADSMAYTKSVEGTVIDTTSHTGTAEEIIAQLDALQERITQAIDRLKAFSLEIENKTFFLNDDIKKKMFGDDFLLKDETKGVAEIITSFIKKPRRNNGGRLRALLQGIAPIDNMDEDTTMTDEEGEPEIELGIGVINEEAFGNPDEDVHRRLDRFIQQGLEEVRVENDNFGDEEAVDVIDEINFDDLDPESQNEIMNQINEGTIVRENHPDEEQE